MYEENLTKHSMSDREMAQVHTEPLKLQTQRADVFEIAFGGDSEWHRGLSMQLTHSTIQV